MGEESYFRVLDVISVERAREWWLHIPSDLSNSNRSGRRYRDVFEESGEVNTIGAEIWSSVVDYLPTCYEDHSLIGRSHRVRFIRDTVSEDSVPFPKHLDEIEDPYPLEKFSRYEVTAQLTILIYLNTGFLGGNASFYLGDAKPREVTPASGRVVIFDRRILHCAEPLRPNTASPCDKFLVKLCALYGAERLLPNQNISTDFTPSALLSQLRTFTEAADAKSKVRSIVCISTQTNFSVSLPLLEICRCEAL
jgi:hypothetical protein